MPLLFCDRPFVLLSVLLGFTLPAITQEAVVTFQVNMSGIEVSPNGVHVAGDFQAAAGLGVDWNPGSTQLQDPDGDGIYSLSMVIPAGRYEYKYINGNAWGMDENPPRPCSVGNTNNRTLTVSDRDLLLPPVPFNRCLASLTFSVNLQGQTISEEGIHVMGNFQVPAGFPKNWDPGSVVLEDLNGDGTYEVELMLPEGSYEYLFVNGNLKSDAEQLTQDCAFLGQNGTNNRQIIATDKMTSTSTFCYGSCDVCDPILQTDYDTYWWNDAVFYELFVRSFYDSDGDGIGDFQGIIEKLDYLNDGNPNTETDLGITAIWLMPMMASPSYHGYDVTDYYQTEPDYGTMDEFGQLLDEAHRRGIRVIIDFVMNHSSNQHPWFLQSSSQNQNFRDWYIWSDHNPGFQGPWGQGVWHGQPGNYYYGLFWSGMPDLNYQHQPVKDEMFKVTRFWLDKGVDGFRLDAIKYLVEDGAVLENSSGTFKLLEEFQDVYQNSNTEAFAIGEVWSTTSSIIPYVQNERLDACFEFDLAAAILDAIKNRAPRGIHEQMSKIQSSYPPLQFGTFLTNHDMDRAYDQLGSNLSNAKLAASIYLMMPGVPFIYYGEEITMAGTGEHENIRRPMQWSNEAHAGFSTSKPWNQIGDNHSTRNVAAMESDPNSLLNHYKRLIHLRNKEASLRRGNYLSLGGPPEVLAFARTYENKCVLVASNFSTSTINASLSLQASSLTPGLYQVTDLYDGTKMGVLTLDDEGGFKEWHGTGNLLPKSTKIMQLSVDSTVSTSDWDQASINLYLSPNPAQDRVNIYWEGEPLKLPVITIYSLAGSKLYAKEMHQPNISIDLAGWPKGLYIIRFELKGRIKTKRLLIY